MGSNTNNSLDTFQSIIDKINEFGVVNSPENNSGQMPQGSIIPAPGGEQKSDKTTASGVPQNPGVPDAPDAPQSRLIDIVSKLNNLGVDQKDKTAVKAANQDSSDLKTIETLLGQLNSTSKLTAASSQKAASKSDSSGGGIIGDLIDGAISLIAWIICTELVQQGKMPMRWYIVGAKVFAAYPEAVKRGYYLWAIPSVQHLRAHPNSMYSKFLSMIFKWRAENIAYYAGVKNARKLWRGAAVTMILWPVCWSLGMLISEQDWKAVYKCR